MAPLSRIGTPLCLALIAGFLIVLTGCGETGSRTVDQIRVVDGAEQCALPGKAFARPVKIELLGPQEPGLLGGKGSRSPAAGSVVLFEPADGSDLKVDPEVVKTDEGGGAVVTVTAGKTTGDQYLRIIPKDAPDRSVTLRFITGMQIDGDNEQYRTGSVSAEPLSVKLVKPDGSPAQGVAVNFDLLATAEGARTNAKILTPTAVTNADGIAETEVKLGDRSGVYNIGISVVSPEEGFLIQNKTVKLLGFNIISVVIALLLPSAMPLVGCLMLGNLVKECGVVDRLSKTVQNELMNIVVIFLGLTVGATATAEAFLNFRTLGILVLGVIAFCLGTAGGVLLAKFMNLFSKEENKINPLIGSAGVSAVPMAARVSQIEGQRENPGNYLLMHAMGPNVAGVVGSAVAAGILLSFLG